MDQFRESLDRIGELTDEELKSLSESVKSQFDTVGTQDPTHEVVEEMTQLVEAAEAIKAESDKRIAEAAQLSAAAEEANARMKGLSGEADEISPAEGEDDVQSEEESLTADETPEENPAAAAEKNPIEAEAEAAAAEEGAPEVEEAEAPAEEPAEAEEAPAAEPETPEDAEDNDPADDELDEEAKKKLENFSADSVETAIDTPAESTFAAEPEADKAPEAEAPAEAEADAEQADEDAAPETPVTEPASEELTENSEEPVTASNTPDFQAPEELAPAIAEEPATAPVTITAGADIPGVAMGSQLPNLRAVAQAILDRKKAMGRTTGGDGEYALVASIQTTFPEDRTLNSSDFEGNATKIEAVTNPAAIVAAGGWVAPVPVRYELFGLGETTDRPVKDSLAVFGADRGGLRYITPPVLTDVNGSVSLWTAADDIAALTDDTKTKPCIRVAAGAEVTVVVDAIPLCLTFGNLGARAYPELVERHTELAMVWHARYAETRLLTRIGSLSTNVTGGAQLGAVRDILGQVDRAAAGYRNRHRIASNTNLRVIFPEWFKDALRTDIAKQLPGDGLDNTLELADSVINSWFAARNINVTWTIDGETGQIMGAQAAGALNNYPGKVIWYLFAEGTFLFLDQGTLDLGLVRDSTLNSTNDYKIFLESFEAVAKVGVESLRVETDLTIRGSASAATVI